jgi:homoserine O-acetyltransferase/O-succinyltransferase
MKKYLHKKLFPLECGQSLQEIEIAYHVYGDLDSPDKPVVWVCHALTANSDVFDWWKGLFGENDLFNPTEFTIVCANVIGGCYGSTGPLSTDPGTGEPYYHDFPLLSIRDLAAAHDILREHLGIQKIYLGIGGSLGGQQLMEWAIARPTLFENLAFIATNAQHSPWGIAFNEAQRMAITSDLTWFQRHVEAGSQGLKAARAIALLSYRHYHAYGQTQKEEDSSKLNDYRASAYQQYQGDKLIRRFNAFTYWTLSKAMDSHNIARGRESAEKAFSKLQARTLVIGITSDLLFPPIEQEYLADLIPGAEFCCIQSDYGHDGFLTETEQLSTVLARFAGKSGRKPVRTTFKITTQTTLTTHT